MSAFMTPTVLLIITTVLYAGYNVFVKASGNAVPDTAQTTVAATMMLQVAALTTSALFAFVLWNRGVTEFHLGTTAIVWAVVAGVCIGGAEIAYLYLFGGVNGHPPMSAALAVPVIVSGTIVIALIASIAAFREPVAWNQIAGAFLIIVGIVVMFHGRRAV
ncbi:MAG: EamA family transporter [Rhodospirillales bacterium]